jgi:Flp pilus assembly pilin Flp
MVALAHDRRNHLMIDSFNVWATLFVGRIAELKDERGQTFVEYALLLTLVAVAVAALAAWSGLVTGLGTAITNVTSKL